MALIKRYSNRKLYDTEAKTYVTLDDLAEAIRQGEEVRVVDHASGEDLTATIFLQILFEQQKKIGGMLPQVFVSRLVRAGGETMRALRSRVVALDPFQTVDDEIRQRIRALIEAQQVSEDEGQRWINLLIPAVPAREKPVHIAVQGEADAEAVAIPVSSETAAPEAAEDEEMMLILQRQVADLEAQLQQLKDAQ